MLYDSEVEVYINRKQSLKSDTGVIGMNLSVQSSKIYKKQEINHPVCAIRKNIKK